MSDVRAGNRERQARLHARRKEQGMEQLQAWLPTNIAHLVRDCARKNDTTIADQLVSLIVRGLGSEYGRGPVDAALSPEGQK